MTIDQWIHLLHQQCYSVLTHDRRFIRPLVKKSQGLIKNNHGVLKLWGPKLDFGLKIVQLEVTGVGTHLLLKVVNTEFVFDGIKEWVRLGHHFINLILEVQNGALSRLHKKQLVLSILLFIPALLQNHFCSKVYFRRLANLSDHVSNLVVDLLLQQFQFYFLSFLTQNFVIPTDNAVLSIYLIEPSM